MQQSAPWLQGIQYFRAIAIIEVILVHVLAFTATVSYPQWIIIACRAFTWTAIPHFVFVSGVVLYSKYKDGFSLSTFYKRRIRAVVPPYVVWSTFYFFYPYAILAVSTLAINHPIFIGIGSSQSVFSLVSTFLATLAIGYQHLWFVLLILQLYLLFPLLLVIYNRVARHKNPIYLLTVLFLIWIGYGLVLVRAGVNWLILASYNNFNSSPLSIQLIVMWSQWLSYLFFFMFGFVFCEHYGAVRERIANSSLKSISLVVLISTIAYTFLYYRTYQLSILAPPIYLWLYLIGTVPYSILLIFFYLKIRKVWPQGFFLPYLYKIGEDSFGIYLVHMFFVTAFSIALFVVGLTPFNLLFYPVLFMLVLVFSYLSVQAIYRLRFSEIIIGTPRRKKESIGTKS